eukprot:Protomagalhaensia_sp_Gyna_25__2613@NODE_248_length_4190_cov_66_562997_g191_i0_p6_GENE_NODE_248_length_4190_cov_66_562997_g191_i0NODE_248_length_4190_cov_66_562997_g191_i0_p6_ORF_typecomplete_len144_score17_49_NODE_248_length_4190_cov_66_562997_g191_i036524083
MMKFSLLGLASVLLISAPPVADVMPQQQQTPFSVTEQFVLRSLSRLSVKELSGLHESGDVPAEIPLGLVAGSQLRVFGSKVLAHSINRFYEGDWVFEAPNCTEGNRTLGYLIIKGRRLAEGVDSQFHWIHWIQVNNTDLTPPS